jgi:ribose 5-phosphate isomerase A
MDVEALKREAGIAACRYVKNGMNIGLGTGSTVKYTIIEIGRRISEEGLEVIGVPTSEATRELAETLGIPLMEISDVRSLDLTIDGADEFDAHFSLIKGGGGALTREKIVANLSKSMIVVADESKRVDVLGGFNLPVEVNPDEYTSVIEDISSICPGNVMLRRIQADHGDEGFYVTDNGGYILDCEFGPTISNPSEMERMISEIDGVVDVGLFVGICDAVFVASPSGVDIMVNPNGRLS